MKLEHTSIFPYPDFNDIKIQIDEPMSSAYFNVHIAKMLANVEALKNVSEIQKATTTQWGTVKLASAYDILNEDGDKDAVLTNKAINDAISIAKERALKDFNRTNKLQFTNDFQWEHGEFVVGLNENIAKRITRTPDRVLYSNVYFEPYGHDNIPFFTAKSTKTTKDNFIKQPLSTGIVSFKKTEMPKEYNDFHVYYHPSGFILVKNGQYSASQSQIKIVWNILLDNR